MKEFFQAYAAQGGIAVFFCVMAYLAYTYFSAMIQVYKDREMAKIKSESAPKPAVAEAPTKANFYNRDKLHDSPFFSYMTLTMATDIPKLVCANKDREACLIDFLLVKFRVFRDTMKKFCDKRSAYDPDETGEKWLKDIIDTYLDGIAKYETAAINVGVPHKFITDFNTYHASKVQAAVKQTKSYLELIPEGENGHRTWSALNMLINTFEQTIEDAEHVMRMPDPQLDEMLSGYTRKVFK